MQGEMAAIVHEVTQEAPGVLHVLHVDDIGLVLPLLLRGIRVGAPALAFHHHAHSVWLTARDTLQHLGVGHGVDVRVAGSEDDRRQALARIGGADGVHDLHAFVHLHQAAVHIPAVVREVLRVCAVVLDILDLNALDQHTTLRNAICKQHLSAVIHTVVILVGVAGTAYEDYTLAPLRRLGISGKHLKQTVQKLAICTTQQMQKIWQHRQKLLQQGTSAAAMRAGIG